MRSSLRLAIGFGISLAMLPAMALAAGPITLGVKGGIVFSNVSPTDILSVAELKWKKGPAGGVFANLGVAGRISVQAEALYVSKGTSFGKSEGTDQAGNSLGSFETLQVNDYVEIPVLLQVSGMGAGVLRPYLQVGPAVAIEVKERRVTTGSVESSVETAGFKSTDFGFVAGAGVQIRTGPGWTLLEARYTHGLINVAEDFYGREAKNRAVMVMAGYAF